MFIINNQQQNSIKRKKKENEVSSLPSFLLSSSAWMSSFPSRFCTQVCASDRLA